MDGAQVGVLEQTDEVSLAGLLESHDSRGLESQVSLEVLGDLSHQTLEGQLAEKELSGLLVPPDVAESHSPSPVSVGLLDSSSGGGRLPSSLAGQILPGSFSSSGFPSGLLCSCHLGSWIATDAQTRLAAAYIHLTEYRRAGQGAPLTPRPAPPRRAPLPLQLFLIG